MGAFADWYFAYPTTYKLLGVAMTSAAKHAVTLRTVRWTIDDRSIAGNYEVLASRVAVRSAGQCWVALLTCACWLQTQSLSAAVASELQEHVCRKYQAVVMRPALTDPALHRAFLHSLQCAHDGYCAALRSLDEAANEFVAEQSKVYAAPPQMSDVALTVDYATHLHKLEHVPIE